MMIRCLVAALIAATAITAAHAGEADVVDVRYEQGSDGTYTFHVTVLGERVLAHPHDNEQPFTRSQSGIAIPADAVEVTVRAHDKVHGWGGAEMTVALKGSL